VGSDEISVQKPNMQAGCAKMGSKQITTQGNRVFSILSCGI